MSAAPAEFGPGTFDACADAIPEGYDPETRTAILAAVAMGWALTVVQDSSGSMKIVSPDGKATHHFTIGRKVRWARIKRSIMDHAAPEKLEALNVTTGAPWDVIEAVLFNSGGTTPPEVLEIPRHVVNVEKMMASAGHAGGYESQIALERTWSDGSVDYKCVKCDHSSENRLSIRSHWRRHLNAGEAEPVSGTEVVVKGVEVPNAAQYAPQQRRVDALAEVLSGLLAGGLTDPEEIAKAALTWVHEQSRKGTRLAAEAEELEDADILQRIRTLLLTHDPDASKKAAELEALRNQQAQTQAEILRLQRGLAAQQAELAAAQQELTTVRSERDRFEARAARAAGDLMALRDLLANIGDGEDDGEEDGR